MVKKRCCSKKFKVSKLKTLRKFKILYIEKEIMV